MLGMRAAEIAFGTSDQRINARSQQNAAKRTSSLMTG